MVKFIDEHLPTLKPAATRRYVTSIEWLTQAFEGLHLDEIGSAKLSEFETTRRRQGVKAPTIRRDLACLSSMFGSCISWEWVEVNPVPAFLKGRKKKGLRESPPRTRYLTQDEEKRLLAAASDYVADAIVLAIDTGLRREEQFALQHGQIDSAERVINLTAGTKNSRARQVPIMPRTQKLLARMPRHIKKPWVFFHPEDGSRYLQLNKGLKAAARRAGITNLTWHDLRRTCGCRLLQDHGMTLEEVRDWLGHSSVQVTEKAYAFLTIDQLKRRVLPTPETLPEKEAGTEVGTGTADKA